MIPYGRQDITEDDINAVAAVLRSDFITQGPAIEQFESAVSASCVVPHAVAVNSATSALHLACLALGLGPGDWLWTSPNTFVASANAALYCGAAVGFVDIDPLTYNMNVDALRAKLIVAEREQRLPKVVMPVHFAGQSCQMQEIAELAKTYGFRVIEDASHAIGGRYRDTKIGSCRYSDITVFSFHPVKIVTTGEGGVATTCDAKLAETMRLLRSHGVTRVPDHLKCHDDSGWYYEQQLLGYNYRMTDLQAALGASQMQRLSAYIDARRCVAQRYDEAFAALPLKRPWQHPDATSAWHLYVVGVEVVQRRSIFDQLRAAGIGVNVHYIPVHTQPYYRERFGFQWGDFPVAEAYYKSAISLPMYPTLSPEAQATVIQAVTDAVSH